MEKENEVRHPFNTVMEAVMGAEDRSEVFWVRSPSDAGQIALMELCDLRNLKIENREDPNIIDFIDDEVNELTKEVKSGMKNHLEFCQLGQFTCYVCIQVGMGILVSREEISVKLEWNGTKFQIYGEQVDPSEDNMEDLREMHVDLPNEWIEDMRESIIPKLPIIKKESVHIDTPDTSESISDKNCDKDINSDSDIPKLPNIKIEIEESDNSDSWGNTLLDNLKKSCQLLGIKKSPFGRL